LIFGADMIAEIHPRDDVTPLFHHELFHLYQRQVAPTCPDALWCGLWGEGLAVYVASRLNPKASDSELLLINPDLFPGGAISLRQAYDKNRTAAVCTALSQLDSSDEQINRAFFSSGQVDERLPPRIGYYLGYLAAADLGKRYPLARLAKLPAAEVRKSIEASLRARGECPNA
jgi:hypothetical protein